MSKNHRPIVIVNLYCNKCGVKHPIWRIDGRRKSPGHIKHIYCHICKERTAHTDTNSEWEMIGMGDEICQPLTTIGISN